MKLRLGRALVLLTVVMAVQIGIVADGLLSRSPGTAGAALSLGDTVHALAGSKNDGQLTTARFGQGPGAVTVLYAFHSECVHSREVAPRWAAHFAEERLAEDRSDASEIRRIAVTREAQEIAAAHAQHFGWSVHVTSLPLAVPNAQVPPGIVASLLSRTPWVFVFDADGVLKYHGHGNDLEELAHSVRALQRHVADQIRLPSPNPLMPSPNPLKGVQDND